jgi:hypothetical protein
MVGDQTYPFHWRQTGGSTKLKNVLQHIFGYTETQKKVAAANTSAVLAATATVVAGRTVVDGFTQPDVPRVFSITTGGTTANIAAGDVVLYGRNVEGKPISDIFTLTDNHNGTIEGTKVFKSVDRAVFPAADGTAATIAIGYLNKIGLHHRLPSGRATIAVVQQTTVGVKSTATQQADPSASNLDLQLVEKNWITPATTPNGTTFLTIFYWFHKFLLDPANDASDFYSTTTSTSTSSTSSSTSSTSVSTSSTSTSISTSSTSTSMTSTSTTTVL